MTEQAIDGSLMTRRGFLKRTAEAAGGIATLYASLTLGKVAAQETSQGSRLSLEDIPNLDKLDGLLKGINPKYGLRAGTNGLYSAADAGNKGHVVFNYTDTEQHEYGRTWYVRKVVAFQTEGSYQLFISSDPNAKNVDDYSRVLSSDSQTIAYIQRQKPVQSEKRGDTTVSAILARPSLEEIARINLTGLSKETGDDFPWIRSFGKNKDELIVYMNTDLYIVSPHSSRKLEIPSEFEYPERVEKDNLFLNQETMVLLDHNGNYYHVPKNEAKLINRHVRIAPVWDLQLTDKDSTGLEAVFTNGVGFDGFGSIYGIKKGLSAEGEVVLAPLLESTIIMARWAQQRTYSNPVIKGNLMAVQERIAEIRDGHVLQRHYLLVLPIKRDGTADYHDHRSVMDRGSENPIRHYTWLDTNQGLRLAFVKGADEQHCQWYVKRDPGTGNLPFDFVDSLGVYNPDTKSVEDSLRLTRAKTQSGTKLWQVRDLTYRKSQKDSEMMLSGLAPTEYCYTHAFARAVLKG